MEELLQGSLATVGQSKQPEPFKPALRLAQIYQGAFVDFCLLGSRRANKKRTAPNRPLQRWRARKEKRKIKRTYCQAQDKVGSIEVVSRANHHKSQNNTDFAISLVASLKACAQQKDLQRGIELHIDAVRGGLLKKNVFIGSALINLYAKCGALEKAQEVFDKLLVRNEVSWTALIAGYTQLGHDKEALNCFEQMQLRGFSPNAVTFACILKACGSIRALDMGQEVHAQILRQHLLGKHIEVANALVDMYAKCGVLEKAQEVFDELEICDVVSWNALITGYTQHGRGKEALNSFEQMQQGGFSPSVITFICVLKACGSIGALDKGDEIHALIKRENLLEKHSEVGNALVDMYAKCGALEKAQDIFDQISVRNVILWTALITGYAQHGHGRQALHCFEQMQLGGFSPDAFTFACILKACTNIKALNKGQEIHAQILRKHLLETDNVVASALVDMYAKCGALEKAQDVFDELSVRGVFLWNALISGYAEHELVDEAFNWFEQMLLEGCSPDAVTFACVLKACGNAGAAYKGQKIHADIVRHGFQEKCMVISYALVSMYAKCGMLAKAQELFDQSQVQNVLMLGALMEGYAQLGKGGIVLNLFNKMIVEGIDPEPVLFTIVLNACSHVGLLDKGQMYFEAISETFGIIPSLEHHTCMVSLFGSAGILDKAVAVIEKMPFSADLTMWQTLLVTCRKWGSTKLARWAFERAVHLDEKNAAAYVFTSNIYATTGRHGDTCEVENDRAYMQHAEL